MRSEASGTFELLSVTVMPWLDPLWRFLLVYSGDLRILTFAQLEIDRN